MATVRPTWGEVSPAPPAMTADDLMRLEDDGFGYELYEGMLVRTMTSPGHGDICQRLGFELGRYARTTGFPRRILQNTLFDLTPPGATARLVLAPGVAICRTNAPPVWNVPHETPLLAVEVVSGSQTLAELVHKAQLLRQAGVDDVWVVDYRSRTVQVSNAQGITTLDERQTLTSPLLLGFALAVRTLFDG